MINDSANCIIPNSQVNHSLFNVNEEQINDDKEIDRENIQGLPKKEGFVFRAYLRG